MPNVIFRLSTDADKSNINTFAHLCYGNRVGYEFLDRINGRYLLCYKNDSLIAMTGISYSEVFKGYEVDWTFHNNTSEAKNCLKTMLGDLLKEWSTEYDIYARCFRYNNEVNCYLQFLMDEFKFKRILTDRKLFDARYCKCEIGCARRRGETCSCVEDIYILEANYG